MTSNKLKSKRVLKGYKQTEIAEFMGITPKTYNRKELGKVEFKKNEIILLSKCLELSMEDINEIFFDNNLPNVYVSIISN